MIDPRAYSITVRRSDFEGEVCFEARVKEFPDLAEYGETFEEVYALAIDAIETTAEIFSEKGKSLPDPMTVMNVYSGRVTLRLPKGLHRALAIRADSECVSLNQYLVSALSYFSGHDAVSSEARYQSGWYSITREISPARKRVVVNVDERKKAEVVTLNNFPIANTVSVYR